MSYSLILGAGWSPLYSIARSMAFELGIAKISVMKVGFEE